MKYEITRGQLITLWIFGISAWLWALTDLGQFAPSAFSAPLVFLLGFLLPASLVYYTIGWRNKHASAAIFLTERVKKMCWNDDGRRVERQQPSSDSPKGNEGADVEASVLAQGKILPSEKQKTEKLIRTKGGIIVILIWMILVVVLLKWAISLDRSLYTSLDNLANMIMLSGIFFAGCYSLVIRRYKITNVWLKFVLVVATIMFMSITAVFLDKWTRIPKSGVTSEKPQSLFEIAADLGLSPDAERKLAAASMVGLYQNKILGLPEHDLYCLPSVKSYCSMDGRVQVTPTVFTLVGAIKDGTYLLSRCDENPCDEYKVNFSTSGAYSTLEDASGHGMMLRISQVDQSYTEVVTLGTDSYISTGYCYSAGL